MNGSDARAVASLLGLPFYDMDLSPEFRATVIDYFIREYEAGRTPNPCVFCNRRIKFGAMWDAAQKLGADYLATGHYAKIRQDPCHRPSPALPGGGPLQGSELLSLPV